MESQGEELSRLRAEVVSLKELLTSNIAHLSTVIAAKDEVISSKDELLASRTAELQRCNEELVQHRAASFDAAAADSSKRQRLHYSSTAESALDRDDVLDVFSFVGGGDHLYIAGVSRRWRDRYIQYCEKSSTAGVDSKHVTRQRSVLMTESRLQLALRSGLALKDWTCDGVNHTALICKRSLEPEKVLTLLRVHGAPWSVELCTAAAYFDKLALQQWLHSHSCPWEADWVLRLASMGGSVAMLEWLLTVTPSWSPDIKLNMLVDAGLRNKLAVAGWLKAEGAVWPKSFAEPAVFQGVRNTKRRCWSYSAVQWAMTAGSGWLAWQCEDYSADNYEDALYKQQATELLEWAHANGCPCTCEHAQQQQQQ
jgi:hypothetical protein